MRSWLKQVLASEVVIHTTEGHTIRGVLTGAHKDCVVLEAARYLSSSDGAQDLAGQVVIDRAKVAFVQHVAAGTPLDAFRVPA